MNKAIVTLASLGTLSLGLGGCNTSTTHLTPSSPVPGSYVQIERLSRPAIKEVFEPFQAHQKSNAVEPYADPTIQADIIATEDALRAPNTVAGTDYGKTLASVLYPDEYTVILNGPAPSGADPYYFLSEIADKGAFGGRAPNDDVIDLELGILFGNTLSALKVTPDDQEENTCLSSQNIGGYGKAVEDPAKLTVATFPYLPAAR
jgi:hypothetical protein